MGDGVDASSLSELSPCGLMYRRAGIWVSLAGMGRNSFHGERGGFFPMEAAVEDPPLWLGAHAQGIGEQDPKPHTPPPLGGDP